MLASWPQASQEKWAEVPTSWVQDAGCDALVLCNEIVDPIDHALMWNTPPVRFLDATALRETVARWLRYYTSAGIEAIGFGPVVLRRSGHGRPSVRALKAPNAPGERASEQLTRLFEGAELLRLAPLR